MRSTRPTLDEADDRPGQVVVDDDMRVLQVLPSLSTSVAMSTRSSSSGAIRAASRCCAG